MKNLNKIFILLSGLVLWACNNTPPELFVTLPEKYDGKTIELINYMDSTVVGMATIKNCEALINPEIQKQVLTSIVIDGKVCGFYITEEGKSIFKDSLYTAIGTPLNDRLNNLLVKLDEIDEDNDMNLYLNSALDFYNENKYNPVGDYFLLEWLRFAEPEAVDSLVQTIPEDLKNSPKIKNYLKLAELRGMTSPGKKYVDFAGEDKNGRSINISDVIVPGKYVLLDFWASWCPYCLKELPDIKNLKDKWNNDLQIIGVAVRDLPQDTEGMVNKKQIDWDIVYNTGTSPYDVYGFAGIPHHILLDPDGIIISRGESILEIDERLSKIKGN